VKRTNSVAEYGISIAAKRNMCSVNGKQEHKDTFYRKRRSYERVYRSQGVSSLSTVTTCTVRCIFREIHAAPDFSLTTKWTTKCGRLKLLLFCSSFSGPRHPNTMCRQILLNQTWPQKCVTDGLPRTQLTALLSNLISQRYKKCNTVDKTWGKF